MNYKIHRGTQEIGGSCVEVWTASSRIIVDFGLPLVNAKGESFAINAYKNASVEELIEKGILPNIQSVYQAGTHTALILSHSHQDHCGLLHYLHSDCRVYLGEATHRLIELTNIFSGKTWKIKYPHYFESGKSFRIGDITITPYLMDHSAFDAYAFLIQAEGKSLFYSGDFRIHGRKQNAFKWFSHHVPQHIDYLLLEGTSIGRSEKPFLSEMDMETAFAESFTQSKAIHLIYTSGQNIDRLVSIYRACKKSEKTFVIDFYIANILKELAELKYKLPYPSPSYPEINVFYPYRLSNSMVKQGKKELLYNFTEHKITKEEISAQHDNIVMLVRPSMLKDITYLENLEGGVFIYSMWQGYKKEESYKTLINYLLQRGMTEKDIHTSGHADREGLKAMVEVLKPKTIVPIHTFEGDAYEGIFENTKVLLLQDNETISIE
jgi:ribonuclease J